MNPCVISMLCALSLTLAEESQNLATKYIYKKSVSDYTKGDLLFEREAVSKVECAAMCMGTSNCTSMTATFLHPSSIFACRGYADPTSTTTTTGQTTAPTAANLNTNAVSASDTAVWVLRKSAGLEDESGSDEDCEQLLTEFISGKCQCSPGYYYSLSLDSCVQSCSQAQLQTQTVAYPGWRVMSFNMGPCASPITLDECLELCANTSGVRTCDFHLSPTSNFCCLQAVTRLNIPAGNWLADSSTTHFQKMCA